jgi:hypothetical protein
MPTLASSVPSDQRVMPTPLGDVRNGFALNFLLERGQEISKLLIFAREKML